MLRRRSTALALVLGVVVGCGGGEEPTSPAPEPDPQASSISISPSSAEAGALEDTTQFSATVQDGEGDPMDVSVDWSSTDASVVTIGDDGAAVAQSNGRADIVASAEGMADTARFTVDQEADEVEVSPSVDTLSAGDSVQLSAAATDANGHEIEEAAFVWSSSDESVATVDSEGLVRAQSEGEVQISAEADDVTNAADLTVEPDPEPGDGPAVSSVSPSPIPEGGTATISGSDFNADPASNTVRIDGAEATVTSASATTLEVTVPRFDCLPARDVAVEVQTSDGGAQATAALEPDEASMSLAAGDQRLIRDPEDFCLQFGETSASERYLIGVQSLSGTPASLTSVTVTSEAADASGAASVDPISLAVESDAREPGAEPRIGTLDAHRQAELRRRTWERRHLDPQASLPARGRLSSLETSQLVSGSVQTGDTVQLRVPDARASDLCANYVEVGAEVKAIGTQGIFVADTANPSDGFTDADYQDFSERMDTDVFSTLVDYFGDPTDLDGNDRVVVLISQAVNVTSPTALGFVWSGDLFSRSSCAASDEGELYYGRAPDPNGEVGPVYPTDQARLQTPFIMAHELTHVIQQTRRLEAGQFIMSSTVAEAQATLGEEVVGHSVTGRTTGQDYGLDVAFNTSGVDEIDWYANGFVDLFRYFGFETSSDRVAEAPDACGWWRENPSPCVGRSLWYGVGWTFLRWASDQFGSSYPGGEQGFHSDLIGSGGTGPENVAAILGESFEELMAQWAASLYVDGRVGVARPEITLPSWDLFDMEEGTVSTAHLQPLEMDFSDWRGVGDIRASSAGYVTVDGSGRPATAVRVRDGVDETLLSDMQMWVVRME